MKKRAYILVSLFLLLLIQEPVTCGTNEEAIILFRVGMQYFKNGKFKEALSCFEKSLKLSRQLKNPKAISINLNRIGFIHNILGKYEKALSYFNQTLKLNRQLKKPEEIAASLNNLGAVYNSMAQFDKALKHHNEALKIRRQLKKPQNIALSLNNIGGIYSSLGQYKKALSHHNEALRIRRKLNVPEDTAFSLNNIGSIYSSLGQFEKALTHHNEALKIRRQLKKPQNIAMSLHNIGFAYHSIGQHEKAILSYSEALNIYRQLKIPQNIALSLNNIGGVYNSLGQYEKTLLNYTEALSIYKQLNIPQKIAISLNNIGSVYDSFGYYDKALVYHEEALKMRKQINVPQDIAMSLFNLGSVYKSLGQYEKALYHYREALKIYKQQKIPQNIATCLNNIGLIYHYIEQYDKALSFHEDALKIRRQLKIPQDISTSLLNIGVIYILQKKYNEAEKKFTEADRNDGLVEVYLATKRYKKALDLLSGYVPLISHTPAYRIQYHTHMGKIQMGLGNYKEASRQFLKGILLIEEMRSMVRGERSGFFKANRRIQTYRGLISSLSERWLKGEEIDESLIQYNRKIKEASFYFAEMVKARTLLEKISASYSKLIQPHISKDFQKREESLINQFSIINNQWEDMYKKGKASFEDWVKRKGIIKIELDSLISQIRKQYPRYAALKYPAPIRAKELPLRKNEILLEYCITNNSTYIYVVKKGGVKKIIKIPMGKEKLESLVYWFILPLHNKYSKEGFSHSQGKMLYQQLLEEALKGMSQKKNIIIVPDGILGLLPFEVLVINAGKSYRDSLYVGDKYNLTYSQSATVLALNRMLGTSKANKPLFALGNPVFAKGDPRYIAFKKGNKISGIISQKTNQYSFRGFATRKGWGRTGEDDKEGRELEFSPLPETETEVKSIANLFRTKPEPPDILLNVFANETHLRKSKLTNYRHIHFATHADLPGKVQGINEPFILLGQVENKGKDDGFLTMSEVLGLKLNADMVVLSACLTGRGKMIEGEGVFNFARAFHHAGAKSVMVSLWEVASKEAVEYMGIFYKCIKSGKTRVESLRLARKKIKSMYPNPYYWAVFILYGEGS